MNPIPLSCVYRIMLYQLSYIPIFCLLSYYKKTFIFLHGREIKEKKTISLEMLGVKPNPVALLSVYINLYILSCVDDSLGYYSRVVIDSSLID